MDDWQNSDWFKEWLRLAKESQSEYEIRGYWTVYIDSDGAANWAYIIKT